jgi:ketosteroid isomerase-like protein
MNRQYGNTAARRTAGHQVGRGEPADLAAVAPAARERPAVQGGHGVQDGDLGVEDLAAAIGSRAHPVNLLPHRGEQYRNDYCWVYTCRDGLISQIRNFTDTLYADRLFGLDNKAPSGS